ncbi:UNVERIFIED_CONTAM: hypothetical protein HDU68_010372 [Siphonaria sp. JEL0065]|nr:hypothetical protein HDU68_010372 [Siphonaria sp. JEL0065]
MPFGFNHYQEHNQLQQQETVTIVHYGYFTSIFIDTLIDITARMTGPLASDAVFVIPSPSSSPKFEVLKPPPKNCDILKEPKMLEEVVRPVSAFRPFDDRRTLRF